MSKLLAASAGLGIVLAGCSTQFQLPADDAQAVGRFAWCADFGADLSTNCGFVTLEQCRAAILGLNGQCYPNPDRGMTEPQATRQQ